MASRHRRLTRNLPNHAKRQSKSIVLAVTGPSGRLIEGADGQAAASPLKANLMTDMFPAKRRHEPARNASALAMIFILTLVFAPLVALHLAARWQTTAGAIEVMSAKTAAPVSRVE